MEIAVQLPRSQPQFNENKGFTTADAITTETGNGIAVAQSRIAVGVPNGAREAPSGALSKVQNGR